MKHICLIISLLFSILSIKGQQVNNVNTKILDEEIEITYDLNDYDDNYYSINLTVLNGNRILAYREKSNSLIFGDIGNGIISGDQRKIYWKVLEDDVELVGDNIVFEISASLIQQNSLANFILPGRYDYLIDDKKTKLLKSVIFYTTIIGGIYFGASSNSNYQKYNNATELAEIQNYYSKANISLQHSYLCYSVSGIIMIDNLCRLFRPELKKIKNELKYY